MDESKKGKDAVTRVAGMRVDPLTYATATDLIMDAAKARQSAYVCVANVHMTMEAADDPAFADIVENALAVTPDGMPLVWMLRALGHPDAERVYGPTLTLHLARRAAREGVAMALYGGTSESLQDFEQFLTDSFEGIRIVERISPPFRPPTEEEDREYTRRLQQSGAGIILVGIGCPKQEKWMAAHKDRIDAVMVGVGAAFDFHSGRVRQAPAMVQQAGMEWAFRLAMEPRRLAPRYFRTNPRFAARAIRQVARTRRHGKPS